MKHSKYKNTGLLFELLVRQITADILNSNKTGVAETILKTSFNKNSELFKENKYFNVLIENKVKTPDHAKELIENTIKAYTRNINTSKLNKEKYLLIKQMKENFHLNDFLKSKVANYKLLASIHNVLSENIDNPVSYTKSKTTLIEHMTAVDKEVDSSTVATLRKENKDLRILAYRVLVERFNKKYDTLLSSQKDVLREYINNISNTNGLQEYLTSNFNMVLRELKTSLSKIENKVIKIKLKECITLIRETKPSNRSYSKDILKLMRFHQLLEDVRNAIKA